jgi:hypothetical protein
MKRTILFCCIASIFLFIASFGLGDVIYDFFLSFFDNSRLVFQVTAINGTFIAVLKLSLSIALIPILLLVVWLAGNIFLLKKRIFSIAIVLVFAAITITFNIFRIQSHEMVMTNLKGKILFPSDELFFEYAIFIGAVLGCILAYLIFRSPKLNTGMDLAIPEI